MEDPLSRTIGDLIGNTPLVRLRSIGRGLPCPILVKCEHLNPGGSIKDRIALAIIEKGEREGLLSAGSTIVEATAGNTGVGLALVAAGHYQLICVMPEKMSLEKRSALRAMGAEVVVTPNLPPDHPDSFQQVARRLAEPDGFMLADQFRNPANPDIHFTTTGPEIWEQSGHQVGAFVAGVGTGGTISGVGRFLKSQDPTVEIVLADPIGSGLAGLVTQGSLGPDGSYKVEGIGSSAVPDVFDHDVCDSAESISDDESFDMARRLVREEGLLVGGSSGTAVAAAVRVATRRTDGRPVIAILPDSWDRYRSTIFTP